MKDFKTILLIIACVIILFLSFYFPNKITEIKNTQYHSSEFITNAQIKEDFYYINFDLNNKMSGITSPDLLYTENDSDSKLLSEKVREKPLLFYRYRFVGPARTYSVDVFRNGKGL